MPERKTRKKVTPAAAVEAAAPAAEAAVEAEAPAAEKPAKAAKAPKAPKAPKAAKAPKEEAPKGEKTARRGRPPLTPEVYVELGGKQYNISDIVERAKADYRVAHKVGVQSCKVYVKPDEATAYYVVNKVEGKLEL